MGSWLTDSIVQGIVGWFAGVVVGALQALWGLLASTAFSSPDVTTLPQVQAFARTALAVVNTVYVLAFLTMAGMILARDTIQSRYGFGELVPRLVIGLIGANFALPLCSSIITGSNALTTALTGGSITSAGSTDQIRTIVLGTLNNQDYATAAGFLLIIIGLLVAVLVGILEIQWIFRIGLLIVLTAASPIALALHATPFTEGAAKLWWRTLLGTLATVVIQATALYLTLAIFLSPGANIRALGFHDDPTPLMNLFIILCLLLGVVRIPALMRRYVTRSRPGTGGQILRLVVIQQITRRLGAAFSTLRRAARPTAAGGGARRGTPGAGPPAAGGGWPRDPTWPPAPRFAARTRMPPAAGVAATRPAPAPATSQGARPGVLGVAYPAGRPVRPYTRQELAAGVDLYTRALKRRAATRPTSEGKTP